MSRHPTGAVGAGDGHNTEFERILNAESARSPLGSNILLSTTLESYSASFRIVCKNCSSLRMKIHNIRHVDNRTRWSMSCNSCGNEHKLAIIMEEIK